MFSIMADYFSLILNGCLELGKPHLGSRNSLSWKEFNDCGANELEEVKLWNGKELRKVK